MKTYLFNPFLKIAGAKAFFLGLAFVLLSSLTAGLFYGRYDGILDMHFVTEKSFISPLLDNLVNISCLTIIFYLNAVILKGFRTRFIDILGTMTLARAPLFLMPLANIGNKFNEIGISLTENTNPNVLNDIVMENIVLLIITGVISIGILVWYVALLWKAYTVSSNVKGATAIISFIIGLLAAEVLSKIIIYQTADVYQYLNQLFL
jgi:hypothetical protein